MKTTIKTEIGADTQFRVAIVPGRIRITKKNQSVLKKVSDIVARIPASRPLVLQSVTAV